MHSQNPDAAGLVLTIAGVKVEIKTKSIVYGKIFDSTEGYPGEGPVTMKLFNKLSYCPTIMGRGVVNATMKRKIARQVIH